MTLKNSFSFILLLGITAFCGAQNFDRSAVRYDYRLVTIDSTLDGKEDPALAKYLNGKKTKLSKEMDVVIGHCDQTMNSYAPQSPLSNFLTDLMLYDAAAYAGNELSVHPDVSILNFGGIRAPILAGEVTVGDIFRLSPFDNRLVFIELKGTELKRVFDRFYPKADVACFSGLKVRMNDGRVTVLLPDGSPVLDDHIYTLVTVDFIAGGGDKILKDIRFESKTLSDAVLRDFIISEIRKLETQGKGVAAEEDERIL